MLAPIISKTVRNSVIMEHLYDRTWTPEVSNGHVPDDIT